jgi:pyruvate,water dikinase
MAAIGRIFEILGMPRESLELLLGLPRGSEPPRFRPSIGTLRHVPRMLAVGARLAGYGPRVRGELHALAQDYGRLERVDVASLDEPRLLVHVDRLMAVTEQAAYANIVTPILMNLYAQLLERSLSRAGLDPRTIDPAAGRADRAAFDPRPALDELGALLDTLDPDDLAALETDGASALATRQGLAGLRASVDGFVERFGHLAASGNDFSSPPWREDPDGVVRMILDHRERGATRSVEVGWEAVAAGLPALERPLARTIWVRAGAYRVYREAVSFRYTRGYALFRPAFLELGRRLVDRRVLAAPDDVYYLTLDELRTVVAAGDAAPAQHETVARRRAEMAEAETLELPAIIFGDDFVPGRRAQSAGLLRGIPTSRGHHRGTARVVRDTNDFPAVQPGDVIVIPHSDIAWTPLFARAGAVVAESGGLLSHSSIVAREHGIPCVVSLDGACSRIADGATIAVDGYTGDVILEG